MFLKKVGLESENAPMGTTIENTFEDDGDVIGSEADEITGGFEDEVAEGETAYDASEEIESDIVLAEELGEQVEATDELTAPAANIVNVAVEHIRNRWAIPALPVGLESNKSHKEVALEHIGTTIMELVKRFIKWLSEVTGNAVRWFGHLFSNGKKYIKMGNEVSNWKLEIKDKLIRLKRSAMIGGGTNIKGCLAIASHADAELTSVIGYANHYISATGELQRSTATTRTTSGAHGDEVVVEESDTVNKYFNNFIKDIEDTLSSISPSLFGGTVISESDLKKLRGGDISKLQYRCGPFGRVLMWDAEHHQGGALIASVTTGYVHPSTPFGLSCLSGELNSFAEISKALLNTGNAIEKRYKEYASLKEKSAAKLKEYLDGVVTDDGVKASEVVKVLGSSQKALNQVEKFTLASIKSAADALCDYCNGYRKLTKKQD